VVVTVRPDLGPVNVSIHVQPHHTTGQHPDRHQAGPLLLWPYEVSDATMPGSADPALVREVVQRGFQVSGTGRLSLGSRERMQLGTGTPPTRLPEAASFVTFTRVGGAPRSWGRPPTSRSRGIRAWPDPAGVTVLTLISRGLVTPKPATWFEELFWGRRWVLAAGFGDIGSPVMPGFRSTSSSATASSGSAANTRSWWRASPTPSTCASRRSARPAQPVAPAACARGSRT
jgi:hypothetical protein